MDGDCLTVQGNQSNNKTIENWNYLELYVVELKLKQPTRATELINGFLGVQQLGANQEKKSQTLDLGEVKRSIKAHP